MPKESPNSSDSEFDESNISYDVERSEGGRDSAPKDCLCLSSAGCVVLWAFVAIALTMTRFVLIGGIEKAPIRDIVLCVASIGISFVYIIGSISKSRSLYFYGLVLAFLHFLYDALYVFAYASLYFKGKQPNFILLSVFIMSMLVHIFIGALFIRARRR
ncbi:unnamed protein product [Auanema sp. JU1783]|nr:unnamed protein product [Auanema sp. JU1783]